MPPTQPTDNGSGDYIEQKWIKAGGDVIGKLVLQLPAPPSTALHSLPAPPMLFVGRSDPGGELETLLAALAPTQGGVLEPAAGAEIAAENSGVVVSALAGMGGVGKTALALAAGAIAHHKKWFCAELFVDLRSYAPGSEPLSAEAALDVLLRQMGIDPKDIPPGTQERASIYRSALTALSQDDEHHRPVLVVADNAASVAQVRPLLPGPGGHRLMATSRSGLHSLAGARHLDLDVLDPGTAVALLASALRSGSPHDVRADDEVGLERLAGVCGHLPLALEITAAQLARKPLLLPDQLSNRLERAVSRVDKLKDPGRDTEQTRVLRAVFETSLSQLAPEEVRVFLLVASAPGAATSTTAAAVLTALDVDEAEEVLEELQAVHLLTQPAPGRWGAHDLLADHARTHPNPPQDRSQALGRLLDHYTDTSVEADARLRALPGQVLPEVFPDREAALAWLDAERATLVAASLAAPALGHMRAAIDMPLHMAEYLSLRHRFKDWEEVSHSAQQAAHTNGDQYREASAWNNLGLALQQTRRFDEAIDAHTHARKTYQQVGYAHGEASAWNNIGLALAQVGKFDEAIDAHTRACEAFQQLGDTHGKASAWNNLGLALAQVGKFDEAIDAHTRAREAFQQLGDSHGEASAGTNLGSSLIEMGRFDEAIDAHTRARKTYQQLGDTHGEAQAWGGVGLALLSAGAMVKAVRALTRAVDLFEDAGEAHRTAPFRGLITQIQDELDRRP